MTTIAVANTSQSNVQEVTLNVVNNVVNRLLLSQEQNFTYQDASMSPPCSASWA